MRKLLTYICLALTAAITNSCQEPSLDAIGETYLDLPSVRYEYNNFQDTTNAISTLGRVLFYDRQLSINNTVSCASCHQQKAAFSDNARFSKGFELKLTSRNSMPIQNLGVNPFIFFDGFSSKGSLGNVAINTSNSNINDFIGNSSFVGQHFFWDGREPSLEKLILQPVGNHIEMGITDVNALAEKLSKSAYYAPLFTDAFQSPEITPDRISKAVTAFISSINTTNTRFDQHNMAFSNGTGSKLNSLELEGMLLFDTKYDCNSCHQVTTPGGYILAGTFANIGLDAEYQDNGLQSSTKSPVDAGKFKIPSLRNVVYTAPYMHDGRFETLEDVIEHYSSGIENHPNLDARLLDANGQAKNMNISEHEKKAIVAFLHTLSDESVLTDPKFSNPFKLK
jgi:cytochrome c peroxidase